MSHKCCPIWQTPAEVSTLRERDAFIVKSPRAGGRYGITGTGYRMDYEKVNEDQKALFTTRLIQERIAGREPMMYSNSLSRKFTSLEYVERVNNLLLYMNKNTPKIGDLFEFATNINPDLLDPSWIRYAEMLAWSESLESNSLLELLDFLQNQALIKRHHGNSIAPYCYSITHEGRAHLRQHMDMSEN